LWAVFSACALVVA